MRVGVYAGSESGVAGTHTIREDLLLGLFDVVDETRHKLVVFAEKEWGAGRQLPRSVNYVSVGRPGMRAVWSLAKRSVNRILSHGLLLPTIFENESWIDPHIQRQGIEFFLNLGPDAVTTQVPYMSTVFDLQHRYQPFMPEVSGSGYWERWDEKFRRVLGRAAYVITGTCAGRDEVMQYYQVSKEKILVLRHPTPGFALNASRRMPEKPAKADRQYVFYPAQFWPHKNHVTLIEALSILKREHGFVVDAVMVGSDQGNLGFVKERARELGVDGQTLFPGAVPREKLIEYYRGAVALTYVSTCGPENLPPLEAFALGCPVIAGVVPGAHEQLGDAALLVDPLDAHAVSEAILRICDDVTLCHDLVRRGRDRALAFTNVDFARGVFSALDRFEQRRKCWSSQKSYRRPHLWTRALGG